MDRDPTLENVIESNRNTVVFLGPIQPKEFTFPSTGKRNLKFQKSWFEMEHCREWLEYSKSKDAAYCFVCRCFGSLVGCSEKQFVETGFSTWSKATASLEKHRGSQMHRLSTKRSY